MKRNHGSETAQPMANHSKVSAHSTTPARSQTAAVKKVLYGKIGM
ncbi:MAG TPA: hypothetical protein VGH05_13850 [Buttiauxella sp.]|jgi:hypothetical protein